MICRICDINECVIGQNQHCHAEEPIDGGSHFPKLVVELRVKMQLTQKRMLTMIGNQISGSVAVVHINVFDQQSNEKTTQIYNGQSMDSDEN